eukprot:1041820-Rhodomonas_salina.1
MSPSWRTWRKLSAWKFHTSVTTRCVVPCAWAVSGAYHDENSCENGEVGGAKSPPVLFSHASLGLPQHETNHESEDDDVENERNCVRRRS